MPGSFCPLEITAGKLSFPATSALYLDLDELNSRHGYRTARNINTPFGGALQETRETLLEPRDGLRGSISAVKGEKQMASLKDKTVLVIGRRSGIARAISQAQSAADDGLPQRECGHG